MNKYTVKKKYLKRYQINKIHPIDYVILFSRLKIEYLITCLIYSLELNGNVMSQSYDSVIITETDWKEIEYFGEKIYASAITLPIKVNSWFSAEYSFYAASLPTKRENSDYNKNDDQEINDNENDDDEIEVSLEIYNNINKILDAENGLDQIFVIEPEDELNILHNYIKIAKVQQYVNNSYIGCGKVYTQNQGSECWIEIPFEPKWTPIFHCLTKYSFRTTINYLILALKRFSLQHKILIPKPIIFIVINHIFINQLNKWCIY